jgi:hypothetical protein
VEPETFFISQTSLAECELVSVRGELDGVARVLSIVRTDQVMPVYETLDAELAGLR